MKELLMKMAFDLEERLREDGIYMEIDDLLKMAEQMFKQGEYIYE